MASKNIPNDGLGCDDFEEKQRIKELTDHCYSYRGSDIKRSILQLSTTLILFSLSIAIMFVAIYGEIYWLYAALFLPTVGFLIRLFIIQHDCGHGSFFSSRRANDVTGRLISILTFIPYDLWKRAHNKHHANSGNLTRRGSGDVDTLTVKEYQSLSAGRRFLYRLYRNPITLFLLGPPVYMLILQRIPPMQSAPFLQYYNPISPAQSWRSVMTLNLMLFIFYGTLSIFLGLNAVVLVYLPVLIGAFFVGQWLFFIQHQFEDTYWEHDENWSFSKAALQGSSYYALPPLLQWFTGNIGFHHIHHLCSMIPNYRLQECFDSNKELSDATRITLFQSLKYIRLALWDEKQEQMVGFSNLKS